MHKNFQLEHPSINGSKLFYRNLNIQDGLHWNAALLGQDDVQLDKRFPRLRRNEVPAFIFRGEEVQPDLMTLEDEDTTTTLRITHPTIQCRIQEDIQPLEQGCGNRTSRTDFNFRQRILRQGLLNKAVHLRVLENAISSKTQYLQDEVFTAKELTCEQQKLLFNFYRIRLWQSNF